MVNSAEGLFMVKNARMYLKICVIIPATVPLKDIVPYKVFPICLFIPPAKDKLADNPFDIPFMILPAKVILPDNAFPVCFDIAPLKDMAPTRETKKVLIDDNAPPKDMAPTRIFEICL